MKKFKISTLIVIFLFSMYTVVFSGCYQLSEHKANESADLNNYKGCRIIGRQFDWDSEQIGAELVSFQKGDSVWTESYLICVWQRYNVGDSVK